MLNFFQLSDFAGGLTPPAGLVSQTSNGDAAKFIFVFILGFIFGAVTVLMIRSFKSGATNNDNKDDGKDNSKAYYQIEVDDELVVEPKLDEAEPKLDKFEEIKKYKELLDIGIITQEEFEIKKKQILG